MNEDTIKLKEEIDKKIKEVQEYNELYDGFIEYIKKCEKNPYFEEAIVSYFKEDGNEYQKLDFLDMILSSEIKIFCRWYKKILLITAESKNHSLAFRANDILSYYQAGFKNVRI